MISRIVCAFLTAFWMSMACGERLEPLDISVGDWPPFFDQTRPYNGPAAHLISDIFAEEGYRVRFHFLPWNRAYREAALGKQDATAIWMYKSAREKDFMFSDPVLSETFVLFYRKDKAFDWSTLEDLRGLTIGGGMGYSYGPAFDDALARGVFKMERMARNRQNFKRLLIGRIDVFPEEISVGYETMTRELAPDELSQITHHPKPFLRNESFVMFPRASEKSEMLLDKFNRRLQKFRESGRYSTYLPSS
ncbi:substrate-binding periplasmic protein [Marinobacter sp. 1Y8]